MPEQPMELLEREAPRRELDAALKDAAGGEGRLALVGGEAGIGKTSLVERFAREHRNSARVLWGACDALITPRPLGPLHDIARQLEGTLPQALASGANLFTLFSACLGELQREATIVVIEDAHWADEATLDLLKYLGRRIQHTRALLIVTYRDDEIGPQHPLRIVLGDLATSAAARRPALRPLSVDAVRALAAERPMDPVALHRQTGGNPFFVTEVIASEADGIPATVRDAVLARVARLSPSARAVLEAAAVIGPRVEPWLLSDVTGAEAQAAEKCLAIGVLLVEQDKFAFRHELARQTILESISPPQLLVLHRLVLEALQASPATRHDLARLAHHAKGLGDREAVLEYAPAAARQASAAGAHREAAALYALTVPFVDGLPPDEQARLLDAYSAECDLTERMVEAKEAQQGALRLWQELGQREKEGRALRRLSQIALKMAENDEMGRYAAKAIAVLELFSQSRELAIAYDHQSRLHMLACRSDETVYWGTRAMELARRLGDLETVANTHINIGLMEMMAGRQTEGQARLEHSLQLSLASGFHIQAVRAFDNLGHGLACLHAYADARRYFDEGLAYCEQHDFDFYRAVMLGNRAKAWFEQGHWAEAEKDSRDSQKLWPVPLEEAVRVSLWLQARRGTPLSPEAVHEARRLAVTSPLFEYQCHVAALLAEAAWLQGDLERCRHEAEAIFQIACQRDLPNEIGQLACWLWRAGAITQPPRNAAEPYAAQITGDWRTAAILWEQFGCPYEQAMALIDGDEAAQLAALDIFDRLGARPAAEMVRRNLQGVPARQLEKAKFGGLTRREREVAALIAQGRSNRDIAAAMTVRVKTVETYVTRILNKLGFDSRVQIATWAMEKDLARPEGS